MRHQITARFYNAKTNIGRIFFPNFSVCWFLFLILSRLYKLLASLGNGRAVEKTLLEFENFQQTMRLVIGGCFTESDPAITDQILGLYETCSTMMDTFLPASEQGKEEEDSDFLELIDDPNHKAVKISKPIKRVALQKAGLPVFGGDLQDRLTSKDNSEIASALRNAYLREYQKDNVIMFGSRALQWSDKLSWMEPLVYPSFTYIYIYSANIIAGSQGNALLFLLVISSRLQATKLAMYELKLPSSMNCLKTVDGLSC